MTPLHLEIVTHYAGRAADMQNIDAPAVRAYIDQLLAAGILQQSTDPRLPRSYELSAKGRAYLDALLSLPFPSDAASATEPAHRKIIALPIDEEHRYEIEWLSEAFLNEKRLTSQELARFGIHHGGRAIIVSQHRDAGRDGDRAIFELLPVTTTERGDSP